MPRAHRKSTETKDLSYSSGKPRGATELSNLSEINGTISDGEKPKKIENYMDVDEILLDIGEFGRMQVALVFIFCLLIIPPTYHTLIMSFAGSNPNWRCVANSTECNMTGEFSVLQEDDYYKRCDMNRSSWEFTQPKEFSIVTEWDLVCSKKELTYLANSAMFIGWAFGAIVLGIVSDRYGRKSVLFPSYGVMMLCALASGFVQNFWLFFAMRLIIGICQGGVGLTLFIMASELVGPRWRAFATTSIWFAFAMSLVLVAVKAYLVPQWRMLEIISSGPYLLFLGFYRFIPESVRWLRVNHRLEEAEQILSKVAKVNRRMMPDARLSGVNSNTHASFANLFAPCQMAICTMILCFTWFVSGMVYYGISLASDDLGGDMYRDFILTSIVEIPGNVLVIVLSDRFGRKKTMIIAMIMAGLSCIGVAIIPNHSHIPKFKWSRVTLGTFGKLCICVSFNTLYIWSVEIYPTIVRSQGMGLLSVVSRCGAASAPWVAQWLRHAHVMLPFALMGGLTLIGAFLCLLLHETKGRATAETLEMATSEVEPNMTVIWENPFTDDLERQLKEKKEVS